MTIIVRLGFLALLACLSLVACKPKGPEQFSPPDHSFTVLMPAEPKEVPLPTKNSVLTDGVLYAAKGTEQVFFAGYFEYTKERSKTLDEDLDRVLDAYMDSTKSRLLSAKTIRQSGNTGRDVRMQTANNNLLHMRYFLVGTRMYLAMVGSKNRDDDNANETIIFLDSLQVHP